MLLAGGRSGSARGRRRRDRSLGDLAPVHHCVVRPAPRTTPRPRAPAWRPGASDRGKADSSLHDRTPPGPAPARRRRCALPAPSFTSSRLARDGPAAKAGNLSCLTRAVRELGAGADAELAVDAGERGLDGVLGEEEGGRDLRFVCPSATSSAMRRSASVSSSRDGARPPMRASSARVCSAQSGRAEGLEARERVLEGGAGGGALLRASLRPAEREQRAGAVERVDVAVVLGERALEAREGAVEVAARGEQQAAATGEDRERPGPVERGRTRLPLGEDRRPPRRARRSRSAPRAGRPARRACPGSSMNVLRSSYDRRRCSSAAAGSPSESSTKPSTQPWPDCRDPDPLGLGPGHRALRPGARVVDPAPVGGDDRGRKLRRGHRRDRAASGARATRPRTGRPRPSSPPATRGSPGTRALTPPSPSGRSVPGQRRGARRSSPRACVERRPPTPS